MWRSLKRLERDVTRWREAGWVSEEGAAHIGAELAAARSGFGLSQVLATLGTVLIAFAAMSFVAANWADMSKLARLALLFGGLWASYGVAGVLATRGLKGVSDAAVLLATALFGASIMLIAQMYHIDGNPPDAVLTWGIGTLLAGVVLGSRPALALAMLLAGLWGGWETGLSGEVFWPFLLAWTAVTLALLRERWVAGLYLAALTLAIWCVVLGYLLWDGDGHFLVVALGLAAAGAGVWASSRAGLAGEIGPPAVGYGAGIAFAGLFALQFVEEPSVAWLAGYAVASLLLVLAAIVWGWRTGNRGPLWLGYAGFSIEILALYFETVGTLMGSSLFFLTAGIIVIALAWLAMRLHRARSGGAAAGSGAAS